MKKLVCILLCLCLLCGLTACTVEDKPSKETETNAESEATKATEKKEETFELNETAVFNNLKVTATEVKESEGTEYFKPADGNIFVGVKFTIENTSEETQNLSSLLCFTAYADDVKCDYSFSAACVFTDGSLDGDIAAGKKMIGWYSVELPADWKNLQVDFIPDLLSNTPAQFVFAK